MYLGWLAKLEHDDGFEFFTEEPPSYYVDITPIAYDILKECEEHRRPKREQLW